MGQAPRLRHPQHWRGRVRSGCGELAPSFYIATDNPIVAHEDDSYCHGCGAEWYERDVYKYPLHRDPETVKWWSEQSDEAQAAFDNPVDLREALANFSFWLADVSDGDLRIWANDPHFDVSILAEAYHAVGLPVPWHYRAPRSMRTVVDLSGLTRDEYCAYGTAHNALDDAIAQAMTVCKCYERLGLVER